MRSSAGCGASCARAGHTDTGMLLMTLTYAFKESFTYERRSEPGTRPPALDAASSAGAAAATWRC